MIFCARSGWLAQNLTMLLGIPGVSSVTLRTGSGGLLDSLLAIQSALEMFCHPMPNELPRILWAGPPTASPKSSASRPSSRRRKNGHRLAANVGNSEVTLVGEGEE